jgi:NAD(P)-dependent dehydrogenase (short-subunit alcohol dehydrogenase family)
MNRNTHWTPADIAPQNGRRVIVTGANSGIGYHAAVELARRGAEVVLACRDERRGAEALARLRASAPAATVRLDSLDLANLTSVRAFAERELAQERPLDLLINNAGVMAPRMRIASADGFELQFGTNVIGHFALTGLLMPALERAAQASRERPRVVTIASIAHKSGRIDFDDLQSTRRYHPMIAYRQSKLANLMLAFELDRRLRARGSRVMSVAAHPGVANTNLFRGERFAVGRVGQDIISGFIGLFLNSEFDGALPTLFAATSPAAADGGYYGPLGLFESRGKQVGAAQIAPQARLEADARRLWEACETSSGVAY